MEILRKEKISEPKVILVGSIHGDEIGGTRVIERLLKIFETKGLSGTIICYPKTNDAPGSYHPRFYGNNNEDLNRLFPGKMDGTEGEKKAYYLFEKIKSENPDFVIDIHNDWGDTEPFKWGGSLTHILIDPIGKEVQNKTLEISKASGLPVVIDPSEITGTLSGTLTDQGIPSCTLEIGGLGFEDEKEIEMAISGIENILAYFGMLEGKTGDSPLFHYTEIKSPESGFLIHKKTLGEEVLAGETVAEIKLDDGTFRVIPSPKSGIVLGHQEEKLVLEGEVVVTVGAK